MKKHWLNLVEFFIPINLKAEYESRRRAKIIVGCYIIAILVTLLLYVLDVMLNIGDEFPYFYFISSCLISLFLFRWKGSILVWGNVIAILILIMLVPSILTIGRLYSDNLLWLILCPILAYLLANKWSGVFWSIGLLFFMTYLYLTEGGNSYEKFNTSLMFDKAHYFLSLFFLFLAVLAIIYLYEHEKTQIIRDLKVQRRKLEEQKTEIKYQAENLKAAIIGHQKTELKLKASNQELQQFAYITAHNLREPVANIIGLINLYDSQNPATPFNATIIEKVRESGNNIDGVVKDLHQIISIKKEVNSQKEWIDLEKEFDKICKDVSKKIADTQTTIVTRFSKVTKIKGIRSYVHSILLNLLTNAIKYCSPERLPEIFVDTEQLGDYVCLSIRDNGLGIDLDKNKEKLFGLYCRFHNHVEGTGLGLYLVKTQLESMDGRVEIDSEVGKGTTFKVYFKNA